MSSSHTHTHTHVVHLLRGGKQLQLCLGSFRQSMQHWQETASLLQLLWVKALHWFFLLAWQLTSWVEYQPPLTRITTFTWRLTLLFMSSDKQVPSCRQDVNGWNLVCLGQLTTQSCRLVIKQWPERWGRLGMVGKIRAHADPEGAHWHKWGPNPRPSGWEAIVLPQSERCSNVCAICAKLVLKQESFPFQRYQTYFSSLLQSSISCLYSALPGGCSFML